MNISQINNKSINPFQDREKKLNTAAEFSSTPRLINSASSYNNNSLSRDKFLKENLNNNESALSKEFETIKSQQGIIGKVWDGIKNIFKMKSGSNYVRNIIQQAKNGKISQEEAQKALEKYKEGQKTCVDVVADITSGILAVGAFALAVPTGGASLAVGLIAATAAGAGAKIGIKSIDAVSTGKEYNGKDLFYDFATGAINGIMAPVTNGLGNCVTKTIGKKLGLEVLEEGAEQTAKQIAKQTAKSVILTKSVDVAGGNVLKRAVSLGAGMAVDGALGGASDNMVRAALDGENIAKAGIQGAIGGLIMAPIIGGGFRIAGKAGHSLNNKITTKFVLPNGLDTKFKQGSVGDCALLSTIDGMMNNSQTAKLIKKSITKTPFGDYNVKIGNTTVKVAKSSLSDEILSDTTGIKIFEQAYKQLSGNLDGGFAEAAAKQFGLNPVHITKESLSDELLDKLAKEQNNAVLSLGTLIDSDGAISLDGVQRHYFTVKNIDPQKKSVIITSPIDTSKSIELSYDDIKKLAISIDGGTIKKTDLPNTARTENEAEFFGKLHKKAQPASAKDTISAPIKRSNEETDKIGEYLLKLNKVSESYTPDDVKYLIERLDKGDFSLVSEVEYQKIKNAAFREIFNLNTVVIGGREIPLTPTQKEIFDKLLLTGLPKKVSKGYYEQAILSDTMFIEAMGVNLGLDAEHKSVQELFDELSKLFIEDQDVMPGVKIKNKEEFLNAFLGRERITQTIDGVGGMSGDKAVHEANKALMGLLETNPEFNKRWVEYCNHSPKFKMLCTLAETYKQELRLKLQNSGVPAAKVEQLISSKLTNEDHLIFRAMQRDFLIDIESRPLQEWSKPFENKTFIDILCDKILDKDSSDKFMHGLILKYKDKFDTLVYRLTQENWDTDTVYIPQYSA